MPYSKDLRERVVSYVRNGGSKESAQKHFKVSRWCVYDWCSREDLTAGKSSGRPRKLDWEALAKDIEKHPDKLLRERAKELNVWTNAVWYACKQMKMTRKKSLRYKERTYPARIAYLQSLRSIVKERGSKNLVYVDESGFEEHTYRPYAWSIKGKKSYGDRCGSKGVRTNLIAAKRQKELLTPILYETSTTAEWFNEWLENHLMKELCPQSTVIMDNARFHKKEKVGHLGKRC